MSQPSPSPTPLTIARGCGGLASLSTIGFGAWHFFVPYIWDWWTYFPSGPGMDELVIAVRAINVFFSLSLVLFGVICIAFLVRPPQERVHRNVLFGAMVVLWAVRVGLQILAPQGSASTMLQYGMLSSFVLTLALFLATLVLLNHPSTLDTAAT